MGFFLSNLNKRCIKRKKISMSSDEYVFHQIRKIKNRRQKNLRQIIQKIKKIGNDHQQNLFTFCILKPSKILLLSSPNFFIERDNIMPIVILAIKNYNA